MSFSKTTGDNNELPIYNFYVGDGDLFMGVSTPEMCDINLNMFQLGLMNSPGEVDKEVPREGTTPLINIFFPSIDRVDKMIEYLTLLKTNMMIGNEKEETPKEEKPQDY